MKIQHIYDYIDDRLEISEADFDEKNLMSHLLVEFKYPVIFEKFGELTRANLTAELLAGDIINNAQKQAVMTSIADCEPEDSMEPFKRIVIEVTKRMPRGVKCAYDHYDEADMTMHIEMTLGTVGLPSKDELAKIIEHEILHGMEDYGRRRKGSSLGEIRNAGYGSASSDVSNDDLKTVERHARNVLYFFNDAEMRAYISRLRKDIQEIMLKNHWSRHNCSIYKLRRELKRISIWKEYFDTCAFISKIDSGKIRSAALKKFIKAMNEYIKKEAPEKVLDDKEAEAFVTKKWRKFTDKVNAVILKTCAECADPEGFPCWETFI